MAATDTFASARVGLAAPAVGIETVTPHDTTTLTSVSRGLWVGGAGNISVLMADGTTGILVGVPAGTLIPIRVQRVNSTSTTATSIVSLI